MLGSIEMNAPNPIKLLQESPATKARTLELFREMHAAVIEHTDHIFGRLMIWQWLFAVVMAVLISPRTWSGAQSQIHVHVLAAIFLGGLITALPVYMSFKYPGR